jgi:hypothetical protein
MCLPTAQRHNSENHDPHFHRCGNLSFNISFIISVKIKINWWDERPSSLVLEKQYAWILQNPQEQRKREQNINLSSDTRKLVNYNKQTELFLYAIKFRF